MGTSWSALGKWTRLAKSRVLHLETIHRPVKMTLISVRSPNLQMALESRRSIREKFHQENLSLSHFLLSLESTCNAKLKLRRARTCVFPI
jgi:hypothetical protein